MTTGIQFKLPPTAQEFVGRFLKFLRSKYYRDNVAVDPTDQQLIELFEKWLNDGEPT